MVYKIKHIPTQKYLKKGILWVLVDNAYGFNYYLYQSYPKSWVKDHSKLNIPKRESLRKDILTCVEKGREYTHKSMAQDVINKLNKLAETNEWEVVELHYCK